MSSNKILIYFVNGGIHKNAVNLLHYDVATDEMVFAYEAMKALFALNLVVWVELRVPDNHCFTSEATR